MISQESISEAIERFQMIINGFHDFKFIFFLKKGVNVFLILPLLFSVYLLIILNNDMSHFFDKIQLIF